MTIPVANTLPTHSFDSWRNRTNILAYALTSNVVTADASSGGSITTGNGVVNGHLLVNTLRVPTVLGGGTLETPNTLTVDTDLSVQSAGGANLVSTSSNTTHSNVTISSVEGRITATTLRTLANSHLVGSVLVANVSDVDFNSTNVNFVGTNFGVTANSAFGGYNFLATSNVIFSGSIFESNVGTTLIKGGILNVASNTIFSGTIKGTTLAVTSNVDITTSNVFINSTHTAFHGGSLDFFPNASFSGTSLVSSANATIAGTTVSVTSNAQFLAKFNHSGESLVSSGNITFTGTNFTSSSNVNITGTDFIITANARFTGSNYKLEAGGNVTFGGSTPNSEHIGTFHGNVWVQGITFPDSTSMTSASDLGAGPSYVQNTESRILSGNLGFTGANVYFSEGAKLGNNTINATFTPSFLETHGTTFAISTNTQSGKVSIEDVDFWANGYNDFGGTTNFSGTISTGSANAKHQTITEGSGNNIGWNLGGGEVTYLTLLNSGKILENPHPQSKKVGFYVLHIIQGNGGSKTMSWGDEYKFSSNVAPILTTTAGHRDIITFLCDGNNMYGVQAPDFTS